MSCSTTLIYSVSELTQIIKTQLESRFSSLVVQGEITNLKPHSQGHLYFDLKDSAAKVPAVMFRSDALSLERMPKEGDHVQLKGSLTVYPPHGKYQMVARSLTYLGVGELLLKFEALKKKLEARGWFKKELKKTLPPFPKTIGVVTSPTGAVILDIIHILSRRFSGFHLILNPVRVQGAEAPGEIAQAIREFNTYQLADVLIVGRGGGSLEDLWAFNDEEVAKAIFESTIPIISAVGHETDTTIADFVADVRAPTPSAAAEIVISEKAKHLDYLAKMRASYRQTLSHQLARDKEKLYRFSSHPLFSSPYSLLGEKFQRLDDLKEAVEVKIKLLLERSSQILEAARKELTALKPSRQLDHMAQKLAFYKTQLGRTGKSLIEARREKIKNILSHLAALDPKQVLKRGYTILFNQISGSVIVSAQELTPGKKIRALLADGEGVLEVQDHD